MPLSPEEIAAIAAGDFEALKPVSDAGIIIRTAEQENEFRNNYREQLINSEQFPILKAVDSRVEEMTGIKKNDKEKTGDYINRILSDMAAQKAALEEKIKASGEEVEPRIVALQKALQEKEEALTTLSKESAQKIAEVKLQTVREKMLAEAAAIPMNVPDAVKPDVLEARLKRFEQDFELRLNDKGQVEVVNRKEGRVEVDTTTASLKRPEELIGSYFTDVRAEEGATGGTGTGKQVEPTGGAAGNYASVKNKIQLTEALSKDGLTSGMPEYNQRFTEAQAAWESANKRPMPLCGE